ncbi:choice-of-anchor B family protein [Mesonia sp. K4-1]|uniref:choice-of-anchor B family protein n=1 Tax=Mesonia sp. K4-1 TaxID=2602760 RepID=UPI0011CB3948|nr:choice-of-anchor B family protein [Mesonia sp. K4-1]TXK75820.1 choice-of-anchor B family protein [Mesonia sp. K4-1]
MKKTLLSLTLLFPFITLYAQTICQNGFAGQFPCNDYDLMSRIDLSTMNASVANDIWGWTDPQDNKEYALIGLDNGTAFINITDPVNVEYLGKLPTHTSSSTWRDIKVYGNYAFIVSEAQGHGMQVFDLTRLRNVPNAPITFTEDAHYNQFGNAHNIVINEDTPVAYAVGTSTFNGGLHMIDISNPLTPAFAGGYSASNYTHDSQVVTYTGPDSDYTDKQIFIGSNEDEVVILDVTNPSNVIPISTISYVNTGYTHQGWFTKDERYFILGDEYDELQYGFNSRAVVFDFLDLDNPAFFFEFFGPTAAIDHNYYVKGDLAYISNYNAGVRIADISGIQNQVVNEIGFFDTHPANDAADFDGVWSVYPYFDSENIILSDINRGLFIIRKSGTFSTEEYNKAELSMWPNPAKNRVFFSLSRRGIDQIEVFNMLGQKVKNASAIDLKTKSIDVSSLSKGMYVVKVNNLTTKKLIVE